MIQVKRRNSKVKVSVVVPVYNTRDYLRQCLDSIICQSLHDIQIICVDDGSDDGSKEILESYADLDDRIIVLTQEHRFAGMARNLGIDHAVGEYLVFWDSDDYLEQNALEKMYEKIEVTQSDICVCSGRRFYENEELEVETDAFLFVGRTPSESVFDRYGNPDHLLDFTTIMVWNKMYRRSFLRSQGLKFASARNGNDVYFSAAALCLAKSISIVEEHLVTYRVGRAGSLVTTLSANPLEPLIEWSKFYADYHDIDGFPERSYANKVIGVIRHCFRNVSSWKSFMTCFSYLRDNGLVELGIQKRHDGYYVNWANEFLDHLTGDCPEDFMAYLSFAGYRALEKETARKNKKQMECRYLANKHTEDILLLKGSTTYKVGRLVLTPARALRRLIKRR